MADVQHPVVLLDIDGLKRELFYNMLADGRLPAFARLFRDAARVRYGTTVYPSETLPAQTSLFTGLMPGRHGIVGNGWLNRDTDPAELVDFSRADTAAMVFGYRLYGWPTLLLPSSGAEGLINAAMYPGARTMYERATDSGLSSTVIFSHISRGATRWVRPSRTDVFYFALSTKARLDTTLMDRKTWATAEKTLQRHGLPDLLTLYLCGLDTWGHHTSGQGQDQYLTQVLEPIVEQLADLFEKKGWLHNTRFALCSDHGHSWLGHKTRVSHATLMSTLEAAGRVPAAHSPLPPGADAYINVIGGSVQIHLKNSTQGDWRTPPDLEHDLLPVARALATLRLNPSSLHSCFSMILVRPDMDTGYRVFTKDSLADPEDYFWEKLDRFPRAFQNIRGLNCPRSGDLVLFADFERGCYFHDETIPRSHGSLAPEDMGIPILFAGPGIARRVIERASIVDVAPTILSLLGADTSGMDGKPLNVLEGSPAD